ncbi:MAG: adenylate kinase [Gammaproteobacteria bacterium]|nr:adenylate kinase [Gammaproteobacteria bacterium]
MRIIILGAPGSGKGVQVALLQEKFNIPEVSSCELLRSAVAGKTPLGRMAKGIIDSGQMVSDEVLIGIIEERISEPDARQGFILDGFPRTIPQAEALDEMLARQDISIDKVMVLDVDADVVMQRVVGRRICRSCASEFNIFTAPPRMDDRCDNCGGRLRHRPDDNEESIGNRLRIYATQTIPLISYYQQQRKLQTIEGGREIAVVHAALAEAVGSIPKRAAKSSLADVRAVLDKLIKSQDVAQTVNVSVEPEAQAVAQPAPEPATKKKTKSSTPTAKARAPRKKVTKGVTEPPVSSDSSDSKGESAAQPRSEPAKKVVVKKVRVQESATPTAAGGVSKKRVGKKRSATATHEAPISDTPAAVTKKAKKTVASESGSETVKVEKKSAPKRSAVKKVVAKADDASAKPAAAKKSSSKERTAKPATGKAREAAAAILKTNKSVTTKRD